MLRCRVADVGMRRLQATCDVVVSCRGCYPRPFHSFLGPSLMTGSFLGYSVSLSATDPLTYFRPWRSPSSPPPPLGMGFHIKVHSLNIALDSPTAKNEAAVVSLQVIDFNGVPADLSVVRYACESSQSGRSGGARREHDGWATARRADSCAQFCCRLGEALSLCCRVFNTRARTHPPTHLHVASRTGRNG